MHDTQKRQAILLRCARMLVVSLFFGIALLTLHLVVGVCSQPSLASRAAASQAQAGSILISPTLASAGPGESVTVTVWLSDVTDYYGLDFRLSFDPSVVEVPSEDVKPLWDLFDEEDHLIVRNTVSNTEGTVWYALTNLNPAEPFSGTGRICSITFSALAPGTTTLHFSYAKGSTREGDDLYPAPEDGEIRVRGVGLTPASDGATTPYAIQVYTLTITNTSVTTDTFWFTDASTSTSALPPPDDLWDVRRPPSMTLGPGLTRAFGVTIAVPYDEVDWITHTAIITATSDTYAAAASARLTTWTGGYWVADRPGPGGPGYVGCRHDINYSGDIDFYQDVQTVIGKYPSTDEPYYDYNHSGDIDFYQDVQRVIGKYPQECPSP